MASFFWLVWVRRWINLKEIVFKPKHLTLVLLDTFSSLIWQQFLSRQFRAWLKISPTYLPAMYFWICAEASCHVGEGNHRLLWIPNEAWNNAAARRMNADSYINKFPRRQSDAIRTFRCSENIYSRGRDELVRVFIRSETAPVIQTRTADANPDQYSPLNTAHASPSLPPSVPFLLHPSSPADSMKREQAS